MEHLTHYGFNNSVRSTLRFQHGLDHDQLERMSGLFAEGAKHVGGEGLTAKNYPKAMEFMREHPDAKHMSEREWSAFDSTLKSHLGINDEKKTA